MKVGQEVKDLQKQLKRSADPERAEGEKKYLKSPLGHYGVTVPSLRKIAQKWVKKNLDASIDDVISLSKLLWESDWHEERMLAVFLLEQRKEDLTTNTKHIAFIEKMINSATGWAQLDGIAVWLVGAVIDKDKRILRYLKKWSKSNNFWVRRTSILAQILQFRRGEGDFELFKEIAVPMFEEGEDWSKEERFFIRKAIGWALRELAPQKPKTVYDFLIRYKDQMSGLTLREGSRKLPVELQKKI